MAEFCKECAHEMWGDEIPSDFKNMITDEQLQDGYVCEVLCEGCGWIYVNEEGKRLSKIRLDPPKEDSGVL